MLLLKLKLGLLVCSSMACVLLRLIVLMVFLSSSVICLLIWFCGGLCRMIVVMLLCVECVRCGMGSWGVEVVWVDVF